MLRELRPKLLTPKLTAIGGGGVAIAWVRDGQISGDEPKTWRYRSGKLETAPAIVEIAPGLQVFGVKRG